MIGGGGRVARLWQALSQRWSRSSSLTRILLCAVALALLAVTSAIALAVAALALYSIDDGLASVVRQLKTGIPAPLVWIALLLMAIALWLLPKWQARGSRDSQEKRFSQENEARRTLAQILGGVLVIGTLYTSTKGLETAAKNLDLARQAQDLVRDGQITRLQQSGRPAWRCPAGSTHRCDLCFGTYQPESDRDFEPTMSLLVAYVRSRSMPVSPSQAGDAPCQPISADVQEALNVLGRRIEMLGQSALLEPILKEKFDQRGKPVQRVEAFEVDLSGLCLLHAKLVNGYFNRANLAHADLDGADLRGSTFEKADLREATLVRAKFQTNFTSAQLEHANLRGATGVVRFGGGALGAALRGTDFRGSQLAVTGIDGEPSLGDHLQGAFFEGTEVEWLTLEDLAYICMDEKTKIKFPAGQKPWTFDEWRSNMAEVSTRPGVRRLPPKEIDYHPVPPGFGTDPSVSSKQGRAK